MEDVGGRHDGRSPVPQGSVLRGTCNKGPRGRKGLSLRLSFHRGGNQNQIDLSLAPLRIGTVRIVQATIQEGNGICAENRKAQVRARYSLPAPVWMRAEGGAAPSDMTGRVSEFPTRGLLSICCFGEQSGQNIARLARFETRLERWCPGQAGSMPRGCGTEGIFLKSDREGDGATGFRTAAQGRFLCCPF